MISLCEAGASTLDPVTGTPLVQCKGIPVDVADDDDAPDFGNVPNMSALGVFAKPAPADADGAAQLLIDDSVPGLAAAIIGGYDLRTVKKIIGELAAGETAIGATGKDFESRALFKDQHVSIVVGNDVSINVDRKRKKIQIAGFGQVFEMNGNTDTVSCLTKGKAGFVAQGNTLVLMGEKRMLSPNAKLPVTTGPATGGTLSPGTFA